MHPLISSPPPFFPTQPLGLLCMGKMDKMFLENVPVLVLNKYLMGSGGVNYIAVYVQCLPWRRDFVQDPTHTPLKIPFSFIHFFKLCGLREPPFPTPRKLHNLASFSCPHESILFQLWASLYFRISLYFYSYSNSTSGCRWLILLKKEMRKPLTAGSQ